MKNLEMHTNTHTGSKKKKPSIELLCASRCECFLPSSSAGDSSCQPPYVCYKGALALCTCSCRHQCSATLTHFSPLCLCLLSVCDGHHGTEVHLSGHRVPGALLADGPAVNRLHLSHIHKHTHAFIHTKGEESTKASWSLFPYPFNAPDQPLLWSLWIPHPTRPGRPQHVGEKKKLMEANENRVPLCVRSTASTKALEAGETCGWRILLRCTSGGPTVRGHMAQEVPPPHTLSEMRLSLFLLSCNAFVLLLLLLLLLLSPNDMLWLILPSDHLQPSTARVKRIRMSNAPVSPSKTCGAMILSFIAYIPLCVWLAWMSKGMVPFRTFFSFFLNFNVLIASVII